MTLAVARRCQSVETYPQVLLCKYTCMYYIRLEQIGLHLKELAGKFDFDVLSLCTDRGCPIIIWTGLNIKIGIVQKVYERSICPFFKMIPQLENHFGKKPVWSLIYFLKCAYFDI